MERRRRFTSPLGEADLRSKSGEGVQAIERARALTQRFASTSPRRGEVDGDTASWPAKADIQHATTSIHALTSLEYWIAGR